jgi:CheY-like chemotaxis protein
LSSQTTSSQITTLTASLLLQPAALCQPLHADLADFICKADLTSPRIPMSIDTKTDINELDSYRDRHAAAPPVSVEFLRILQVEDDATNRNVAEQTLRRAGHHVTSVENGHEAIEILKDETYDLILMDRHMPVMDGIEATKLIRQMEGPVAKMPIVGITAGVTQQELRACLAAGMNICLTKPVNPRILIEAVHRYGSSSQSILPSDKISREVAMKQFARLGRDCDVASSGAEALQLIEVHGYDTVFTDITMPNMDGVELTRHLREISASRSSRHMPIIAVTGHVSLEDRKRFIAAGMDDVITKPITIENLAAILDNTGHQQNSAISANTTVPIDLRKLSDILGEDDPKELTDHLAMFVDQFPKLLKEIDAALVLEDRQASRDSAHAARSAATYAAAKRLSALLATFEKQAGSENFLVLRDCHKLIEQEFAAISNFLNARL